MSAPSTDQLFLGRQPILDREQRLVAYELLFRNGSSNFAEITDGALATATVIANAFTELGIEAALGCHRGFINVDEQFLFSDLLELLPRQSVVLELLETIQPTAAVIERCKELKIAGFTLALDDVIELDPEYAELLAQVEIIKVDIQLLTQRLDAVGNKVKDHRQATAGRKSRLPPTNGTVSPARLHAISRLLLCQANDHCRQKAGAFKTIADKTIGVAAQ